MEMIQSGMQLSFWSSLKPARIGSKFDRISKSPTTELGIDDSSICTTAAMKIAKVGAKKGSLFQAVVQK